MKILFFALFILINSVTFGQHIITGKVLDLETKEPLVGVNVAVPGSARGTTTNTEGIFKLVVPEPEIEIQVSYLGYEHKTLTVSNNNNVVIALFQSANNLNQVVVTASREASLRTESPVAISKITTAIINDTKPVLITELINKVPGVVMLNYNNEQHAMSIRQPMGVSPYFLYMEDGIPVRPMGVFNHNALIEMNVFSISNVEVVKGPASSLYGPEAVGGAINFITHRPTAVPTARLGIQADQWGYRRFQYSGGGMISKKLGIYMSGFEARQRDAWQAFSDYNKSSFNGRMDYSLTDKTKFTFSFSGNEYYSDMSGNVDSIAFYNREYTSNTDFTYRKVHSQRTRLTTTHYWNTKNETGITFFYRSNYIEQNPNYAIRWQPGSNIAAGEVNRNSFYSTGFIAQHSVRFNFLDARLLVGSSMDHSPVNYWAYRVELEAQLREDRRSVQRYILLAGWPDDFIVNYHADLKNSALYSQFEINPVERLKATVGLRYDRMAFDYTNYLDQSTGRKAYGRFTPKVGATYDMANGKGFYMNYSQGFSPPGLTAIFRRRPAVSPGAPAEFYYNLEPARFDNFEIGGWSSLFRDKVYLDVALYHMDGHKELLNIRQPDNSYDYQSAGRTLHRGIEYSITYKPHYQWFIRFGGTNALHRFTEFTISTRSADAIKNVNGNDMPQSPRWIANSEVIYKPAYIKGLRLSLEWQRISAWYQDQVNHVKYDDKSFFGLKGVSYLNLRAGYAWKSIELFMNVMNITDELYANAATRGNSAVDRTTFTPAAPRTFVMGVQYGFSGKK